MGSPGVTVTRVNGTLSIVTPAPSKPLVIGPCSGGVVNQKYTFAQPNSIAASIGLGPAQIAAGKILADNGGSIDVIVANASNAGTVGAITSGSGVPAMTIAGTPFDSYQGVVTVQQTGALGAGRFSFTLDGGNNSSPNILLTGSYSVPNTGLTLTFPSTTYTVGQSWAFSAFAPSMDQTDLIAAGNVFTGSLSTPTVVYIANDDQSAAHGVLIASAADELMTTYTNNEINCPVVTNAGGVNGQTAAVISDFNAFAFSGGAGGQNVGMVVAERANILVATPFMGYGSPQLPFGLAVASRIAGDLPPTNPARVATGPLPGVSSPTYDETVNGEVYLDAAIAAPYTIRNYPGIYLEQGVLKSPTGSPYNLLGAARVLLLADTVVTTALKNYINKTVRTNTNGSGTILPADANKINADVNSQLQAAIMQPFNAEGTPGWASGVQFTVDTTNDILETSILQATCIVVPLANISNAVVQLSFAISIAPASST